MLYFRVDMNKIIATGHVMRCLAIADAARAKGEESCFILADDNAVELIASKGYETVVLGTRWDSMEEELPSLLTLISRRNIDAILVDSYSVTHHYIEALRKITKVIYIDDLYEEIYPVDAIINYDGCIPKDDYLNRYSICGTRVLYGYDYVPLRREFAERPRRKAYTNKPSLLIMSGGSDKFHAIARCLSSFDLAKFDHIYAVCGRYNDDYDMLVNRYSGVCNVTILKAVDNLRDYMIKADIAVTAAGNTIYELAACGTPMVSFIASETQLNSALEFQKKGLAEYCGDIALDSTVDKIRDSVYQIASYREGIEKASEQLISLVDGKGAERIAEVLLTYSSIK